MSVARVNITSPLASAAPLHHAISCWLRGSTLRGFGSCLMARNALRLKVRMNLPGQKIDGLQPSSIKSGETLQMRWFLNDWKEGLRAPLFVPNFCQNGGLLSSFS